MGFNHRLQKRSSNKTRHQILCFFDLRVSNSDRAESIYGFRLQKHNNLNIERIICQEDIIRNKNCKFNAKYFFDIDQRY